VLRLPRRNGLWEARFARHSKRESSAQNNFDRGCTIRDRVQAGQWSEIDDREWLLDPQAAWVR
jgi:hypothetical protein